MPKPNFTVVFDIAMIAVGGGLLATGYARLYEDIRKRASTNL